MKRKAALVAGLWLIGFCIAPVAGAPKAKAKTAWRTYSGAWFDVKYPANFKARPSQISNSSDKKYDSAFFAAPDGSVEFYIFSPMWNGTPDDIKLNPAREVLESHKIERKEHGKDAEGKPISINVVHWYTARAKDGSYSRAWMDREDTSLNTRLVFGIKYRNQKAYDRYKADYLRFKESLQQYLD